MINKIKLDGVPLDAISDLESDYESIIKATIKHSDAVIIASDSLSKFNKIYRIFRKTFYLVPKDEFAEAYTNFIKKRFYQIKILLANMYNNSFFKKILVVACVVFLLF
jgi:starch synthase